MAAAADRVAGHAGEAGGMRATLAELRATLALGAPLIAAQLATVALTTTDVVMIGWLGPTELAAAALATSVIAPFLMFGFGTVMGAAPMLAQAFGARRPRELRRSARQGLWIALALALTTAPIVARAEAILLGLGQPPELAALAGGYARIAAPMLVPAFAFALLRGFFAAHGESRIMLTATLAGVAVNAALNWLLIFGNLGLPRLELQGAAIATVVSHAVMAGLLFRRALTRRPYRRYRLLARLWKPDWPRFSGILRLGVPIGLTMAAEVGLFASAAFIMGWIGPTELAAHAVALQIASVAFMIPLGLSHATATRVGLAVGQGSRTAARRAATVSLGATLVVMGLTACAFWLIPGILVGAFLDPSRPENATAIALAGLYLGVAAIFQLADGTQVSASAALRGLGDTRVPAAIAILAYWGIGLGAALLLAFPGGLGGLGVWIGLAAGLAAAAAMLTLRLARRLAPGAALVPLVG